MSVHFNHLTSSLAAYPLDYNKDGLTDFLVLNGRGDFPGPTQLLTPSPTP